jgi:tetratricopeptide (TPR) repeat protein
MTELQRLWDRAITSQGTKRWAALENLVSALEAGAEMDEAIAVQRQLVDEVWSSDNFSLWAESSLRLAEMLEAEDRCDEAVEVLLESPQIAFLYSDANLHGERLTLLANVYGELGKHDEMVDSALAATLVLDGVGDEVLLGAARMALGQGWVSLGDRESAVQSLEGAAQAYGRASRPFEVLGVLSHLAVVQEMWGALDQAATIFRDCLSLARYLASLESEQEALHGLGRCALARGDFETAERALQKVVSIKETDEQRKESVRALRSLANLRRAQGRETQAIDFERQVRVLGRAVGLEVESVPALG